MFYLKQVFLFVLILSNVQWAQSQTPLEQYNSSLLIWGTSWKGGEGRISHYYPSFYTGFAPRSQSPERIHIRTSRGNQTRVSVLLDEKTIMDYLFDLEARSSFYQEMTTSQDGQRPALDINPEDASLLPQLSHFQSVIDSPVYQIKTLTQSYRQGNLNDKELYQESLKLVKQLNTERVFFVNLDLNAEFTRWKKTLSQILDGDSVESVLTRRSEETIQAINTLVWGRINYTEEPTDELVEDLQALANLALSEAEAEFQAQALSLFTTLTEQKFKFKTLGANGEWREPIHCEGSQCYLTYPEFSAVYPTGSYKGTTKDKFGNRIPRFATPGLWPFLDRSYHEVDHIRKEPYYGWAPKMDFEGIGNGFHNPAVRFYGSNFNREIKELLNAPSEHEHFWAVKRGGVSSGCLRLALGHVWEMRHLMPVENDKMKQVFQFGNDSEDFDLYDIDGDGTLEVIGVEYMISYDTQGSSGLSKRDGKDLNIGMDDKYEFYQELYGDNRVFEFNSVSGQFEFVDPSLSFPSYMDLKEKRVKTSFVAQGVFPLYEQTYERDKVQFYSPITTSGMQSSGNSTKGMRLVRLMGRVKGCAPTSNSEDCGKDAFEQEKQEVLELID